MDFVVIGRHKGCKWCDMAGQLLHDTGRTYAFYDVEGPMGVWLKSLGLTTVPQVWHGTKYIGGYEALVRYLECGEAPAS